MTETPETITEDELARLREGARTLGKAVIGQRRAMEAARIELAQGSAEKAMQWILNSLPDVWDDPETEWDGKESAEAWFDRTEAFYRASERAAEPPGDAGPGTGPPEVSPAGDVSARERAGAVPALPVGAGSEDIREGDGELPELRIPPGKPISDEDVAELRERFAEAMKGRPVILPSDRWRERAEAAEATVAEIEAHCRKHAEHAHLHCPDLGMAPVALVKAADILAIIGTEPAKDGSEGEAP
jgi:hypothetical protein